MTTEETNLSAKTISLPWRRVNSIHPYTHEFLLYSLLLLFTCSLVGHKPPKKLAFYLTKKHIVQKIHFPMTRQ
jgi:hypothetical protein